MTSGPRDRFCEPADPAKRLAISAYVDVPPGERLALYETLVKGGDLNGWPPWPYMVFTGTTEIAFAVERLARAIDSELVDSETSSI